MRPATRDQRTRDRQILETTRRASFAAATRGTAVVAATQFDPVLAACTLAKVSATQFEQSDVVVERITYPVADGGRSAQLEET